MLSAAQDQQHHNQAKLPLYSTDKVAAKNPMDATKNNDRYPKPSEVAEYTDDEDDIMIKKKKKTNTDNSTVPWAAIIIVIAIVIAAVIAFFVFKSKETDKLNKEKKQKLEDEEKRKATAEKEPGSRDAPSAATAKEWAHALDTIQKVSTGGVDRLEQSIAEHMEALNKRLDEVVASKADKPAPTEDKEPEKIEEEKILRPQADERSGKTVDGKKVRFVSKSVTEE